MKSGYIRLSHDIGIDLGTANTLLYLPGKGVVINEPSVVAVNKRTKTVLAIGKKAKDMIGKTPRNVEIRKPLIGGVVNDFDVTEHLLRTLLGRLHREYFSVWQRPRVVIGIPSDVTEVERRAVEQAALNAGARKVLLIEEPIAAAIGSNLPIRDAAGSMIVDIGGGSTEVAVLSLGGIVVSRSLRIASEEMTRQIMHFLRAEKGLYVGEQTAETVKLTIGGAISSGRVRTMPVRGRDVISGLPKEVSVSSDQVRLALAPTLQQIIEAVKVTLEETPPELLKDIMQRGIILSGGGSLLDRLDTLLEQETKMPVKRARRPLETVARGAAVVFSDAQLRQAVLIPSYGR